MNFDELGFLRLGHTVKIFDLYKIICFEKFYHDYSESCVILYMYQHVKSTIILKL